MAMIESIVRNHVLTALSTDHIPVYLDVDPGHPGEYVVLERTGGGVENHINRAQFAVQSYATTMAKAAALNEKAKAAMDSLITLDNIGSSALQADYNFTDTSTKKYRYQAVYDIVYCTEV